MTSTILGLVILSLFLILAITFRFAHRLRPWTIGLSLVAGLFFVGSLVAEGMALASGDKGMVVVALWSTAIGWALFLFALLTSVVATGAPAAEIDPGVDEYLAVRAEKERQRVRARMGDDD